MALHQARAGQLNRPQVSVIMAVFNGEKYVKLAIDSVLNQDFDSLDLVIVDDCSSDETPEIIRGYQDPRLVCIRNDSNLGQTKSLNVALAYARGEFISRIDADDVYMPGKLRQQYAFMRANPKVAVCGAWAIKIDAEGQETGFESLPTRPEDIKFRILYRSPVCHVSVMMRHSIISKYGSYDSRFRFAADFALWSTLVRNGHVIANIPERLVLYREFPQSLGAIHKVGAAGDEAAEIIQTNVRELVNVELSRGECRNIALLYFPSAGLTATEIGEAYLNLKRIAKRVYGVIPIRVWMELMAILFWSLVKTLAYVRNVKPLKSLRQDILAALVQFRRYPAVIAMTVCAYGLSIMGERRLIRLKQVVLHKPWLL